MNITQFYKLIYLNNKEKLNGIAVINTLITNKPSDIDISMKDGKLSLKFNMFDNQPEFGYNIKNGESTFSLGIVEEDEMGKMEDLFEEHLHASKEYLYSPGHKQFLNTTSDDRLNFSIEYINRKIDLEYDAYNKGDVGNV